MKVLPPEQIGWWVEMVPETVRKQFPELTGMVTCLNNQFGNREVALSFFWKIYDLSQKGLLQSLEELDMMGHIDGLERKLNNHLRERLKVYSKSASEFFVYIHVAGAFLITLEVKEPKFSERFIEVLNSVDKLCQFYEGEVDEFDEDTPIGRSAYAVLGLMAKWLFDLRNHEGNWEEALGNLAAAVNFSQRSNFCSVEDLDPQAPVDTFERLWDNPQEVKSWKDLASYCRQIRVEVLFYDPAVEWKEEEIQGLLFWEHAGGLCTAQLSPSDAVQQRQLEKSLESETRLKSYFFADCWADAPPDIREKLKNIDGGWFSPGKGDFGDIFTELQVVTQDLIRLALWDPFILWQSSFYHVGRKAKGLNQLKLLEKEQAFDGRLQYLKEKKR